MCWQTFLVEIQAWRRRYKLRPSLCWLRSWPFCSSCCAYIGRDQYLSFLLAPRIRPLFRKENPPLLFLSRMNDLAEKPHTHYWKRSVWKDNSLKKQHYPAYFMDISCCKGLKSNFPHRILLPFTKFKTGTLSSYKSYTDRPSKYF